MAKAFALLTTRPETHVVAQEYEQFLRAFGLPADQLHLIRADIDSIANFPWEEYAAIILGGSPFNTADPVATKSPTQLRVEREVSMLLDDIVAADHPFLGACYGIGTLGVHQGGVIDQTYGESSGAKTIQLTPAAAADPLLQGFPESFQAFAGHKEALSQLPASATLLASSEHCPVQMFRVKTNVYATQFHPEMDQQAMLQRCAAYQGFGYFAVEEYSRLQAEIRRTQTPFAQRILRNFALRYAGDSLAKSA